MTELIVGAPLTVKPPTSVVVPASGLVVVTSRGPAGAPPATVTFTVRLLELLRVVELTVMPVPENDTATPTWKLVPTIARFWFVAP